MIAGVGGPLETTTVSPCLCEICCLFRDRPPVRCLDVACECETGEGVQGWSLTLFCSGAAQVCHDDRVVELKEQLEVEEEDGDRQEEKVEVVGRSRIKEGAPWMIWR